MTDTRLQSQNAPHWLIKRKHLKQEGKVFNSQQKPLSRSTKALYKSSQTNSENTQKLLWGAQ